MILPNKYSLGEQVSASNTLKAGKLDMFTIEAMLVDGSGISYRLRELKKEFPESSGCQWNKESEITSLHKER